MLSLLHSKLGYMLSLLHSKPAIPIGKLLHTDINIDLLSRTQKKVQQTNMNTSLKVWGMQSNRVKLYHTYLDMELLLEHENLETFGKANYLLIQSDQHTLSGDLEEVVTLLRGKGYTPVLARAERYPFLQDNYSNVKRLLDKGCLMETELLSLCGKHGAAAKRLGEKLMKEEWVSFVGTGAIDDEDLREVQKLLTSKKLINQLQAASIKNRELLV
ncbi:hypothetical protein H8S90_08580 [Olivibacter sp. SDN3]|uniref:CpsB/CapC family capsule biosynthesis tyrosine phosphatase n=1 Tax=Olivibacter sp. SDN3 TaxID=2764720 RepID=UPI0016510297|nr:CpsB/CapC family capsule biosynthesis tyrosine phosphatase [Olivibacter sp. SDN3]QNL51611.1 hypothetical protein H8S90_08580 [Olivibacter sp. SDN3]